MPAILPGGRRLGWAIYLAIALGLALATGLIGASALLAAHNADALRRVSRTLDTLSALATVLRAIEGAETGQRGYLLPSRDSYLDPYRAGLRAAPAALDRLDEALRETAGTTVPEMAALRRAAADKLDELAQTLQLAMAGDPAVSMGLIVNELVTNALKYAYRGQEPGAVRIWLRPGSGAGCGWVWRMPGWGIRRSLGRPRGRAWGA